MRKITKAAVMVIFFGAMIGFGTYSYFSDTETSNGNAFAAGKLDLRFQSDNGQGSFSDVNGNPIFDDTVNLLLGDMKPGDKGEKTVKLWVDDNPSCGKVSVNVTEDFDNTCTEPEIGDESACAANPTGTAAGSGELNDNVEFVVWSDVDCENDYDEGVDNFLTTGIITENKTYNIGELPISEANAKCYGIAYCFGTFERDGTCNGANVNNSSQTDSFKADLIVEALQKRNQFDECPVDGGANGDEEENISCVPTSETEVCGNEKDDNCNGMIDEGCYTLSCDNINCNDNNPCTNDSCDPSTLTCSHTPAATQPFQISCNDGNACSISDTCYPNGLCYAGFVDINNPNCYSGGGCSSDAQCDDANSLTIDTCSTNHSCQHTPITCNDNNDCTVDSLDSILGCVYDSKPLGSICFGNSGVGTCSAGNVCTAIPIIIPGPGESCNDNNPCTTDTLVNEECTHTYDMPQGFSCSGSAAFPACNQATGQWWCACLFGGSYPGCPTPHLDLGMFF